MHNYIHKNNGIDVLIKIYMSSIMCVHSHSHIIKLNILCLYILPLR